MKPLKLCARCEEKLLDRMDLIAAEKARKEIKKKGGIPIEEVRRKLRKKCRK